MTGAKRRAFGTVREGGAFEVLMVGCSMVTGGRITLLEVFEVEDAERALARFAELCAEREGRK